MHIFYTITSYPPAIGGTQIYMHRLASYFVAHRHRVDVATFWDQSRYDWLLGTTLKAYERELAYWLDQVEIHRLGISRREKLRLLPFVLGYYMLEWPAIEHISDMILDKLKNVTPTAQVIHNVRQGREGLSFASLKYARERGIPFVFTPTHHPRWKGWLYRHFLQLYREADAVIALTQEEKSLLMEFDVREERIHVTGMGPTLAAEAHGTAFRQMYDMGTHPMVLFLGTHYRYKGLETFLLAAPLVWQRFPETRFVIIGHPTAFSRQIFPKFTDSRVLKLGAVDLQTKTDALAACDLLCVPSTQESFGGVYTEAWMMRKPVIGGNIPAIREVISDGVDGFVVAQNSVDVAERICRLLDSAALRAQMGLAGEAKVLERYTWDKLAKRTAEIYLNLM